MITPPDFLSAANRISQLADTEAGIRSAISRYYYAAYHRSHQFHATLPIPGLSINARGRHNQLITRLINPSSQLPRLLQSNSLAIGNALLAIRNLRIPADYHLGTTVSIKQLAQAAQLATAVFALA